ncbi:MAG: GspH/FimT family pseudopilin [Gemmatimonadota bacterium]
MSRGFTLVEVLVVLVILGIAAAVVVPALPRMAEEDPLARSAEEVTNLLRRSRRTALERGAPVALTVDADANRYWVEIYEHGEWRRLVEDEVALSADASLTAEAGRAHFVFRPDGRAQGDPLGVRYGARGTQIALDPWLGDARAAR